MPPRLIEAIGYHHHPHLARSDGRTAMVLHLANQLAGSGTGSQSESGTFRIAREASGEFEVPAGAVALGLSSEDIVDLLAMHQALTTKASAIA
jgi:hypothetical protein